MAAVVTAVATARDHATEDRIHTAAHRMYEAEVVLHAARQARVDEWIAAAYNRLHEAIVEHAAALGPDWRPS